MRTLYCATLVVFVAAAAAGCGGSGRLSASAYRSKLATISHQANEAQTAVERRGLHAKSISDLTRELALFANASQRLGDEVKALKPPKDADSANALLERGEYDTATAVRTALPKLARMKSVKAAITYLSGSLGNEKGGRELDQAITQLKKLGYTKGS
jgi:hypothetical protein